MSAERTKVEREFERLRNAPLIPFPEAGQPLDVPDTQGVYIIETNRGRVLHVGKSNRGKRGLHQRLRNHLYGKSSFARKQFNRVGSKLRKGHSFRFIEVKDPRIRTFLEAYATGVLCPVHVGTGEKLRDS